MFLHVAVILSTGACLSQCIVGYTPPADTPWSRHPPNIHPQADTPRQTPSGRHSQEQTPLAPGTKHLLSQTPVRHPPGANTPKYQTPPRADTPLEQTPPWSRHPPDAMQAGRYGQQEGGTHPTGMHTFLEKSSHVIYKTLKSIGD